MSPAPKQFVSPIDQSERVLADGRVAVAGEPIDLDVEAQQDSHNARLIEEGQLLELDEPQVQQTSTKAKSGGEK